MRRKVAGWNEEGDFKMIVDSSKPIPGIIANSKAKPNTSNHESVIDLLTDDLCPSPSLSLLRYPTSATA